MEKYSTTISSAASWLIMDMKHTSLNSARKVLRDSKKNIGFHIY